MSPFPDSALMHLQMRVDELEEKIAKLRELSKKWKNEEGFYLIVKYKCIKELDEVLGDEK